MDDKVKDSIERIRGQYHKNPVIGDQIGFYYFWHDLEVIISAAENAVWLAEPLYMGDENGKVSIFKCRSCERLAGALRLLYDKYENGTACFDEHDGENFCGNIIGNAVKLSDEEDNVILQALKEWDRVNGST